MIRGDYDLSECEAESWRGEAQGPSRSPSHSFLVRGQSRLSLFEARSANRAPVLDVVETLDVLAAAEATPQLLVQAPADHDNAVVAAEGVALACHPTHGCEIGR